MKVLLDVGISPWAAPKGRKICRATTSGTSRERWRTSMALADTGYWLALVPLHADGEKQGEP